MGQFVRDWFRLFQSAALAVLAMGLTTACGGGGGASGGSPPPALDVSIDSWYVTQSAQNRAGTVPLVANRDGLLRVFVRANMANTETPAVRVSIGGQAPLDIPAPSRVTSSTGIPTSIAEGDLGASWDLLISGTLIQPGMTIQIEVDPAHSIPESNLVNDVASRNLDVRSVPIFRTTIFPVTQGTFTGNVAEGGRSLLDWVDRFQRMYPIQDMPGGIEVLPGAVYTTDANLETGASPDATQTDWSKLLLDLETKRQVEHLNDRYYFGAVAVSYGSGIAGLGYRPIDPADPHYRTAIGWDKTGYLDGGNFPEVFAHEVGHNLGRLHAPCPLSTEAGAPSQVDPNYPAGYTRASIGIWGWDYKSPLALKSPLVYKDIMSYCEGSMWVSDYMYNGIMNFRNLSPLGLVVAQGLVAQTEQTCLLVSGRIRNGEVLLEPAFKVSTLPQPPRPGDYTLQLQDTQGNTLREISFEPVEIADLPGGQERHFVFAIPLEAGLEASLGSLRVLEKGALRAVRGPSGTAARMMGVREPVSVRMRPGQAHLSWDPLAHPRVMVRDPRTGEVLSIAEGGSLDVVTDAAELDVTFSDGVNSTRKLLAVQ